MKEPLDVAAGILFFPWDWAVRRKRSLVRWAAIFLGVFWVMGLIIPVALPTLLVQLVKDVEEESRKCRGERR
jgi:hypothetical protein